MDYIREELLRQRAALSLLFLGGPAPEEVPEDRRERRESPREEPFLQRSGAGVSHPGVREADAVQALTLEAVGRTAAGWSRQEPSPERWSQTAAPSSPEGKGRAAASASEDPLDPIRIWSEGGTVPGGGIPERRIVRREAAAEAEELSRIFQQDARRYDGGFVLY